MDHEDRESVVQGTETLAGNQRATRNNGSSDFDPYFLANSNNPGMQLVTTLFDGTNFQGWSRNVKRALASKMKLGFINGGLPKPARDSLDYHRWERCDNMVMSWLICSIVSEISRNFVYATSSYQLWTDLFDLYAETNAPLVFQLQRELGNMRQGNLDVGTYYGNLKRIWDELGAITEILVCTCGAYELCSCALLKRFIERENVTMLMRFLMGLIDAYEGVRNSILTTDPLSNVRKAFHLVQAVETQKRITGNAPQSHDILAVNRPGNNPQNRTNSGHLRNYNATTGGENTRGNGLNSGRDVSGSFSKDFKRAKYDRKCSYCQENGHVRETCFKIVGYPEWWKGPKIEGSGKMMAHIQEAVAYNSPLDSEERESTKEDVALANAAFQKFLKAIKGKAPVEDNADIGHG